MRRTKRGDDRQHSEPYYNKSWKKNEPPWSGEQATHSSLPVYDSYFQSTPRPLAYPRHFSQNSSPQFDASYMCSENMSQNEKKNNFTSFLQMFTSFLVEARNKEDDMNILRDIFEPLLNIDRPSKQIESLDNRLKQVEESLINYSLPSENITSIGKGTHEKALIQRLELLEQEVRNFSSSNEGKLHHRVKNLENELSGETSLSERLETLEIIIHGNLIQRIENIEEKCNSLWACSLPFQDNNHQSKSVESGEGNSFKVDHRMLNIESDGSENGSLPKRIELLESRLSELESNPETSTKNGDKEDSLDYSRRKRKESERNNENGQNSNGSEISNVEPKVVPVVQDTMRFIVDEDDFVSIFIDGVGSNSTENSPGIRIWFGEQHPLNVSRPITNDTTNNVAQLMATQIAIDISNQAGLKKIIIHTSSKFLINSMAKLNIWHTRKWLKKNGQSLKHVDKLKRLRRSLSSISVLLKEAKSVNEARLLAEVSAKIKKERE